MAKQTEDKVTSDLLAPGTGVVRQRGRPPTGTAMTAAERKRKSREKHRTVAVAVDLPVDLVLDLQEYLLGKDMTMAAVMEKLLRTQLLRKR